MAKVIHIEKKPQFGVEHSAGYWTCCHYGYVAVIEGDDDVLHCVPMYDLQSLNQDTASKFLEAQRGVTGVKIIEGINNELFEKLVEGEKKEEGSTLAALDDILRQMYEGHFILPYALIDDLKELRQSIDNILSIQ